MKRTLTLAMLMTIGCLTAIPITAHARYRDGMNLYILGARFWVDLRVDIPTKTLWGRSNLGGTSWFR
ncbi:MAG: hypothetical protein QGG42_08980 [Phycisphaerae bacterium]|nr:hypothetical protein [Phycisphaerae bacterium]